MRWFGEPWPSADRRAEVCSDEADRIDPPVGQACLYCAVGIAPDDRGVTMPYVGELRRRAEVPVHLRCLLSAVLGPNTDLPEGPWDYLPGGGIVEYR